MNKKALIIATPVFVALVLIFAPAKGDAAYYIKVQNLKSLKNYRYLNKRVQLTTWFMGAMKNMYGSRLMDSIKIGDSSTVDSMGGITGFWAAYGGNLKNRVHNLKKAKANMKSGRLKVRIKGVLRKAGRTWYIQLHSIGRCR